MASPKVDRSQPVSESIGSWKKPMAERGPKVSMAIRAPATMISQGMEAGFGLEGSTDGDADVGMGISSNTRSKTYRVRRCS